MLPFLAIVIRKQVNRRKKNMEKYTPNGELSKNIVHRKTIADTDKNILFLYNVIQQQAVVK